MGLLAKQLQLQQDSFGLDPRELRGEELGEFVRWNILACEDELHEALHMVRGWKPWSSLEPALEGRDREEYVEELVDALHFIGNLFIVAGVTDEELEQAYEDKRQVNAARQAEGYAR